MPQKQTPLTTFAQRLATARKARGWSQAELARRLKCSQGIINQIELGGVAEVKMLLLFKIADALEVNARWLAIGTGTPVKWVNITPDEKHLLAIYNGLAEEHQSAIVHMATALPRKSPAPTASDPFAGVKKPASQQGPYQKVSRSRRKSP